MLVTPSARGHMTHKSWGSTVSDTDIVVGGNYLGSPTNSAGKHRFQVLTLFSLLNRQQKTKMQHSEYKTVLTHCDLTVGDISKIARTSSTGTMSSNDDADEKDGGMANFESSSKTEYHGSFVFCNLSSITHV